MSHRHRILAAVVVLLLLAAALRFHGLGVQSFWNDEGNSARLSERSLPAILEGTASDIHPPLYYVLLRAWRELAGETEFGLRVMSAYAGILIVAVVFALARRRPPRPLGEGWGEGADAGPNVTRHLPPATQTASEDADSAFITRRSSLATQTASEDADPAFITRRSSLIALLLAAASPVLVYYSQETRMYALLALLAALSTWALWVWLSGAGWRWAVVYVLLASAGLYTHYFFPAVMAAQGLVVLLVGRQAPRSAHPQIRVGPSASKDADSARDGRAASEDADSALDVRATRASLVTRYSSLVTWLALAAAAVVLYLPWLPIFLRQVGGRGGERTPVASFLAESWRWLVLGSTVGRDEAVWALVAAALLAVLSLWVAFRPATRHPSASEDADSAFATRPPLPATAQRPTTNDQPLLVSRHWPLVAVPLALMYLVGATDPAFLKFLLAAVPFLCVLMGLAWAVPRRWLWLPGLLTVLVLAGSAVSLNNLYTDPALARADYRGMAARIAADARNVGVILVAPNQWEVFTYYHRDGAPVYPLPLGQPDPALLEPELARIAAQHERLYVLYWGEGQRDPQGVIERWLDANTFKASEEWVGDVRLVVYAVAPAATTPATSSGASFAALDGETITLREYTVWPTTARPGDVVGVRLVWSADTTPARPYKVFLHLLAADGRLVAQRDGEPGGGSRPTTGWAAGELVVDNHGLLLPVGLPPGEYDLRLGLYDAFDPAARLTVDNTDSLSLGMISVAEEERDTE